MKTDLEIQRDVMEEIKWTPDLNLSDIGVCCKNGVVTLSGRVANFSQKVNAEKAAKRVSGVMAVAENIHVGLSAANRRTDSEIAEAVLNALKWNSAVQDEQIKVQVEDSYVTLEGLASTEYQRSQAQKAIEALPGIKGIFNLIKLQAAAAPEDIRSQIEAAFRRSATLSTNDIQVSVNGNKVTLQGSVRSILEKEDAGHVASSAPGIMTVDNELEIEIPSPSVGAQSN